MTVPERPAPPTDEEVAAATDVLVRALKAAGHSPLILTEFGTAFEDKYLFTSLDYVRSAAGALGFDTEGMRDPNE